MTRTTTVPRRSGVWWRALLALVLALLTLAGGFVAWVGCDLPQDYLEMSETPLWDVDTDYDYRMELLIVDRLGYVEQWDGSVLDYYLAAFVDGEGALCCCTLEVEEYDSFFEALRAYGEDEESLVGECTLSGCFTFQYADSGYEEVLGWKDECVAVYTEGLQGLSEELGLISLRNTGCLLTCFTLEGEDYDGLRSQLKRAIVGSGAVMAAVGAVGLFLLLRRWGASGGGKRGDHPFPETRPESWDGDYKSWDGI